MKEYIFNVKRSDLTVADKKLLLRIRRITPRKYIVLSFIIGILLWIPAGICWGYLKQNYGLNASLCLIVALAFVLIYGKVNSYISSKNIAELQYKSRKDLLTVRMMLSDEKIKTVSDENYAELNRNEISEIELDDSYCFIYIGPLFCYVIPKSGFSNETEFEELAHLLQQHT